MSTARKILSNTFVQVAGRVITAVLSVIVVKILTVYLGDAGYGRYGIVYEFLAFFGAIADLGLFTIAVREMSKTGENNNEIFGNTLSLRTIFATFAVGCAIIAAFIIPKYSETVISHGIAIAAIGVWFYVISGTVSTILQVKLKMQFQSLALVLGKILTVVLIVLVTKIYIKDVTDTSFYYVIWAGTLGAAITFIVTVFFVRNYVKVRFLFNFDLWKKLFNEAWPFGIALILNQVYFRLDTILFSLILPYSENGICAHQFCGDIEAGRYLVAVRILEVLIIMPLFFMNSVLPVLSRHIYEKSKKLKDILHNSYYFLLATGVAGAVGLAVIARPVVRLISTDQFLSNFQEKIYASDVALQFLMGAMLLSFLSTFFNFALIALGYQRKILWINLIAVLFNLVSNIIVIPHYGLVGAAITSVISEVLILVLGYFMLKKITTEFAPGILTTLKIILSAVLMGIVVYFGFDFLKMSFSEIISVIIIVPLGGALFISLLMVSKAVTKDMIGLMKKR